MPVFLEFIENPGFRSSDIQVQYDSAQKHMSQYFDQAKAIIPRIALIKSKYTKEELKILRSSEQIPASMESRVLEEVASFSSVIYGYRIKQHSQVSSRDYFYSFHYRWGLCLYLKLLERMKHGSSSELGVETFVNDLIDMEIAAWGTIYDGVISRDRSITRIYGSAKSILDKIERRRF